MSEPQLLVKAIINVKEHQRKTKSGAVSTVRAHVRNVDRQAMIQAIAKERRAGLEAGLDKAAQRHLETGGRVIHLQHRDDKWRTANTKPQDHAEGSYIRLQDSKVHHYENGKLVGKYDLHDTPDEEKPKAKKPQPKPEKKPVAAKPETKAKPEKKADEKPTAMHVATRDSAQDAYDTAKHMSAKKPGVAFHVGEKTVRRGGANHQAFFVHEGARSPHLFHHETYVNGKKSETKPEKKASAKPAVEKKTEPESKKAGSGRLVSRDRLKQRAEEDKKAAKPEAKPTKKREKSATPKPKPEAKPVEKSRSELLREHEEAKKEAIQAKLMGDVLNHDKKVDRVMDARRALARAGKTTRQKTGDFKDVGEKIGGARKDTWMPSLKNGSATYSDIDWGEAEKNPEEAHRLIIKANLIGDVTPESLKTDGHSSGGAFLASKVIDAIASKPPADNHEARMAYACGIERVKRALMANKNAKSVYGVIHDLRAEHYGELYTPHERVMFDELTRQAAELRTKIDAANLQFKPFRDRANELDGEISKLKYRSGNLSLYTRQAKLEPLEAERAKLSEGFEKLSEIVRPIREELDRVSRTRSEIYQAVRKRNQEDPLGMPRALTALGDRFVNLLKGNSDAFRENAYKGLKLDEAGGDNWSWAEQKAAGERTTKRDDGTPESLPKWEREVPEEVERKGGKVLKLTNGEKLKPEALLKHFGLRAVEYGNWVNDAEAAHHTQRAGEAMLDLADALGIDPKEISYGGRLGMAFGARGKGRALAHYEPMRKAINMTKFAGGGSLAHEWGHFLDNVLNQVSHGGQAGHMGFMSEQGGGHDIGPVGSAMREVVKAMKSGSIPLRNKANPTGKFKYHSSGPLDRHLAEHPGNPQAAFDAYINANPTAHDHYRKKYAAYMASKGGKPVYWSSREASGGHSEYYTAAQLQGKYWASTEEMFARAFESYVADKLESKGMRNTYLVADRKLREPARHNYAGRDIAFSAYPQGAERERINAAFDKLIAAVKETQALKKAIAYAGPRLLVPVT